jgi:hypothetical protein
MNEIIKEKWIDFHGNETEALSFNKDGLYTISEFIQLLEKAKEIWGNKEITFHDINSDTITGFSHVYLNHGFDEREQYGKDNYEEDTVCIYG